MHGSSRSLIRRAWTTHHGEGRPAAARNGPPVECAQLAVQRGAEAIVLPCNTATVTAIDALRERFEPRVPVIGTRARREADRSGGSDRRRGNADTPELRLRGAGMHALPPGGARGSAEPAHRNHPVRQRGGSRPPNTAAIGPDHGIAQQHGLPRRGIQRAPRRSPGRRPRPPGGSRPCRRSAGAPRNSRHCRNSFLYGCSNDLSKPRTPSSRRPGVQPLRSRQIPGHHRA